MSALGELMNNVNELLSSSQKIVWFLVGVLLFGALLQPYFNLPARVSGHDDSIRNIESRLYNSERKLDQVICMLEAISKEQTTIGCAR